jgi:hypothetical protein
MEADRGLYIPRQEAIIMAAIIGQKPVKLSLTFDKDRELPR